MRVDLYKTRKLLSDAPFRSAAVETRDFTLDGSLDDLDSHAVVYDEVVYSAYKRGLAKALLLGREYEHIGSASCDNMAELEKIGVGKGHHGYTVIIDFSNHFDYMVHVLTGCPTAKIRSLPDYATLSYAIMNNDFSSVNFPNFGRLLDLDTSICDYFNKIYMDSSRKSTDMSSVDFLVYTFYYDILNVAEKIKSYVFLDVKRILSKEGIDTFVQRSKTYSSLIISCDQRIEDKLEIVYQGHESLEVNIYSYKKYEYLERRLFI